LNSCNSYQSDKLFYGDDIYLTHKATGHELYIERCYKSPTTGFTEGILLLHKLYYNKIIMNLFNINYQIIFIFL
jgi:hypothetical protein